MAIETVASSIKICSIGHAVTDELIRKWAAEINEYHVSVGWNGMKAEEEYAEGHTLWNYWNAWNRSKTVRQRIGLIKEYADYVAYGAHLRSVFTYYDDLLDHFKAFLPAIYGRYNSSEIVRIIGKCYKHPIVFEKRIELLKDIRDLLDEPWREILPEETEGTIKQDIAYMLRLFGKKDVSDRDWISDILKPLLKDTFSHGRHKIGT